MQRRSSAPMREQPHDPEADTSAIGGCLRTQAVRNPAGSDQMPAGTRMRVSIPAVRTNPLLANSRAPASPCER